MAFHAPGQYCEEHTDLLFWWTLLWVLFTLQEEYGCYIPQCPQMIFICMFINKTYVLDKFTTYVLDKFITKVYLPLVIFHRGLLQVPHCPLLSNTCLILVWLDTYYVYVVKTVRWFIRLAVTSWLEERAQQWDIVLRRKDSQQLYLPEVLMHGSYKVQKTWWLSRRGTHLGTERDGGSGAAWTKQVSLTLAPCSVY